MNRLLATGFVIAMGLWSLGPFLWQWATSLKDPARVSQLPPVLPPAIDFTSYGTVLQNELFLQVIVNSMVVALGATLLSLAIGSLGAFGILRLMTKGQGLVLFLLLVIFMIPQVALVTPLYKMMIQFQLRDTLFGLILVYSVFAVPLVVWIMVQTFESIPLTLYHAARVDGSSLWTIYSRIYLPLGRGGLVSAALLSLLFCWNEFLFALTFTSTYAGRTIPVGISLFTGQYEFPWGEISAATSIVTFPILLIVVLAQKYLVRGMVSTGIKG